MTRRRDCELVEARGLAAMYFRSRMHALPTSLFRIIRTSPGKYAIPGASPYGRRGRSGEGLTVNGPGRSRETAVLPAIQRMLRDLSKMHIDIFFQALREYTKNDLLPRKSSFAPDNPRTAEEGRCTGHSLTMGGEKARDTGEHAKTIDYLKERESDNVVQKESPASFSRDSARLGA